MATTPTPPSPEKFFDMAFAFERTAAIKTAVDLDLFTAVAEGAETAADLAQRCAASERGVRILCDFLSINGLLTKSGDRYQVTPEGRQITTAVIAASNATVNLLIPKAA